MLRAKNDLPAHMKFGYDHAIEMARIRKNLEAEGFTGAILHMETVRCYQKRHENDLSMRVLQQIARENAPVAPKSDYDLMREVLELIRDGYNDARTLAAETLEKLG